MGSASYFGGLFWQAFPAHQFGGVLWQVNLASIQWVQMKWKQRKRRENCVLFRGPVILHHKHCM
jgi:hypothetical protein